MHAHHGCLAYSQNFLGVENFHFQTRAAGVLPRGRRIRHGGGGGRESHWQDHWQQCLFVFGDGHSPVAVSSRMLTRGVPVTMIASHDDTSISFFSIDTGCRRRVSRK